MRNVFDVLWVPGTFYFQDGRGLEGMWAGRGCCTGTEERTHVACTFADEAFCCWGGRMRSR